MPWSLHLPPKLPEMWSASQRRGLIVIFAIVIVVLAIRLTTNRATIPDPQPARGRLADQLNDRLDPNQATAAELAAIPGIGPKRAQAMVDYRQRFTADHPGQRAFNGPQDLERVRGIGPAITETLEGYLVFPEQPATRP